MNQVKQGNKGVIAAPGFRMAGLVRIDSWRASDKKVSAL